MNVLGHVLGQCALHLMQVKRYQLKMPAYKHDFMRKIKQSKNRKSIISSCRKFVMIRAERQTSSICR